MIMTLFDAFILPKFNKVTLPLLRRYHAPPTPSATHKGVAFEKRSLRILQEHLSMSLQRIGGKDDGGVDLRGWWWLPPPHMTVNNANEDRRRVRVIAQCKAEKKKMGPNYVRELEGVMHRDLTEEAPYAAVALLISESAFTASTLRLAQSSKIPLLLLHLPSDDDESGLPVISTAFWNSALMGQHGILGGGIDIRWERSPDGSSGRPGLWYRGERLKSWIPDPVDTPDVPEGVL
ncbi:hypothetical protein OE88DRAFT_1665786 [Heliocybe sulcata]|uniref:Restriction endonuclease type IV Mrr domain-containing protein n=1 Tax=Heliocybe sulcata TaxID=5364 RepID=A0A5C3MRC1_9AGAM|nr:hypothetical protein OE88DRAFT_1665786 [Heliocybe sulcata]